MMGMLSGAELDIFVPSFPEIQKHFGLSPFTTQLTVSLNFIAYSVCSLFVGSIGDKYDRKTIIIYSLYIFIFGTLLCIITDSYIILLAGRILQGVGIAGPSVLGYVLLADKYNAEKQMLFIGWMHSIIAFSMSAAPVLGSYLTHYFGWRSNFIALLLFGIICLICTILWVKSNNTKPDLNISLASYLPLIKSKKLMLYVITLCLFMVPYWVFIGIAPMIYRNVFGVSIEQFGFYQGALAIFFATGSAVSGVIAKKLGKKFSFFFGFTLCCIHVIAILCVVILSIRNPIIITACMVIASFGVSIPINMLYPHSLEVIDDSKGKIAAFISAARLLLSSAGLWIVSLLYNGTFLQIGIWIITTMSAALILSLRLMKDNKHICADTAQ